jgi:hypothetical protein
MPHPSVHTRWNHYALCGPAILTVAVAWTRAVVARLAIPADRIRESKLIDGASLRATIPYAHALHLLACRLL